MEDEDKKGQDPVDDPAQSGSPEEVDADQVFNEAIGEAAPVVDDGNQGTPEVKPVEAPAGEKPEASETPKEDDNPEILRKRLADTQKWGHEVSQEVAALKKKIEEMESESSAAAKAKADEVPENVKAFYDDFPGFADAVQFEAQKLLRNTLGDVDIKAINETVRQAEAQRAFEQSVVYGVYDPAGKFVEGHSDAYRVMAAPDFKVWAEEQSKVSPEFLNVTDPVKAIEIISRFKEHVARDGAKKHDEALKGEAERVRQFASGGIPQGTGGTGSGKPRVEEDPEKIFNAAAGIKG